MSATVLVTGADGQLGRELARTAPGDVHLVPLNRRALDVSSPANVADAFERHRPAIVINAAAYTAVDRAEQERDLAAAVNVDGPRLLAEAARNHGARLIHVSTDFVFDGTASTPYAPAAETNPLGVYGATKRAGEVALSASDHLIVRTGWVYASRGNNFVNTMLRLMKERDGLGVVADQIGTPTWAHGLAEALWSFAARAGTAGIYHWSDAGVASWYDFAVAIQEEAVALGLLERAIPVTPITAADYPTPARRPAYSVLDKTATWQLLGITPMHWRTALRNMLCATSSRTTAGSPSGIRA